VREFVAATLNRCRSVVPSTHTDTHRNTLRCTSGGSVEARCPDRRGCLVVIGDDQRLGVRLIFISRRSRREPDLVWAPGRCGGCDDHAAPVIWW